jgi:hypothetical protein
VPSSGGVIYLPAGKYKISSTCTVTIGTGPVFLLGAGLGATTVFYSGSGDCLRMSLPVTPAGGFPGLSTYGGGVLGLTIDGASAAAGATGLHIGDGQHYMVSAQLQHFNGTGSVGLHIDNAVWSTQNSTMSAVLLDCTTGVLQSVSGAGATASNTGNDYDWLFFLNPNQTGISMQGVIHSNGRLRCRGIFNLSSSTNSGIWLNASASSIISNCFVDVALNLALTGTAPQTMQFSEPGFQFSSNWGRLVFAGTASTGWVPCPTAWSNNILNLNFSGDITGDSNIHPAAAFGAPSQPALILAGSPVLYAPAYLSGATGKINDMCGDFFAATLSADITVGLGAQGTKGSAPGPQRKTVILTQAASGTGPFTVTWPHNTSPTPLLPTVKWAGGTAPVMSTGARAVDVYDLKTLDGATWYGTATQNVS